MILAGTGHRRPKLIDNTQIAFRIKVKVVERFMALKPESVISGMALDFDTWLAELAVECRIPFDAYVPCSDQSSRWPRADQVRYNRLLAQARRIVLVHEGPYVEGCMQRRDERMMNDADALLACFNGSKGGTFTTVRYATLKRKPIHFIDPNQLT